jgi:anti-sigma factor RsiW
MNGHERIRAQLPLAASGALPPGERTTIEQHAAACPACRRELETLRVYASGLRKLPQPMVPPGLLQATRARILHEQAAAAERRGHALTLALLTAFSWCVALVNYLLFRELTGGVWRVLGANLADAFTWYGAAALLVWTTAGAAVLTLGKRAQSIRRVL